MANPVCSKAALLNEAACYGGCVFDSHDQLALEVYGRIQTVKAIGGTDYTGNEAALMIAAHNVFGQIEEAQQRQMQIAIIFNNADASGAAISANPKTLAGFISKLRMYSEEELREMNLFLQCSQGANKAYPQ